MKVIHKHDAALLDIIGNFIHKKILLVGDIILDKYVFGEADRISPEAPVPILHMDHNKDKYVPGGAANTANNIVALGGEVFHASVTGNDSRRAELIAIIKKHGIHTEGLIADESRPTIMKTRVVAQNQQLLRIDHEKTHFISAEIEQGMLAYVNSMIDACEVIIISDYGKGVVTKSLSKKIFELAHQKNKKVITDPKQRDKEYYYGAYLITPNLREASEITGMEAGNDQDIELMGQKLREMMDANVLITRGKDGMTLFQKNDVVHIPTKAREVFDVSGAGDTVVGALALALAAGAALVDAVVLANYAAGIVVSKFGTATITAEELKNYIEDEARFEHARLQTAEH